MSLVPRAIQDLLDYLDTKDPLENKETLDYQDLRGQEVIIIKL